MHCFLLDITAKSAFWFSSLLEILVISGYTERNEITIYFSLAEKGIFCVNSINNTPIYFTESHVKEY